MPQELFYFISFFLIFLICIGEIPMDSVLQRRLINLAPQGSKLITASSLGLWCTLFELFKVHPILRDLFLASYGANQIIVTSNISEANVVYVGYGLDSQS